jgi:DNA-binding NarL/FixJ family response regulator
MESDLNQWGESVTSEELQDDRGDSGGRSSPPPRRPPSVGCPRALLALVDQPSSPASIPRWAEPLALPPRLLQVAVCLALGSSATEAAVRLGLTPHTLRSYTKQLYNRLGVRSRIEVAARVFSAHAAGGEATAAPVDPKVDPAVICSWAKKHRLPPRLTRVASCIVAGLADKETASELGLSEATVRTYVKHLYQLLRVSDRTQLLRRVLGQSVSAEYRKVQAPAPRRDR